MQVDTPRGMEYRLQSTADLLPRTSGKGNRSQQLNVALLHDVYTLPVTGSCPSRGDISTSAYRVTFLLLDNTYTNSIGRTSHGIHPATDPLGNHLRTRLRPRTLRS